MVYIKYFLLLSVSCEEVGLYEVKEIRCVPTFKRDGIVRYLVHWARYIWDADIWEKEEHLQGCQLINY